MTYGAMVFEALEAAEVIAEQTGARAEVIDLRTLAPLDMETVYESVRQTNRCMLVHGTPDRRSERRAWLLGSPKSSSLARRRSCASAALDSPVLPTTARGYFLRNL